ncbi:MAG: MarC family protein [Phycisphaerales bacterium]|jgi:multiple antibiotic resistance protein
MQALLKDFVTFFVAVDPVGTVPVFLALAAGRSPAQLRAIATKAVVVAAVVLCCFAAFGQFLLEHMGVSLPAFRVAGGIILFRFALSMIFSQAEQGRKHEGDDASSRGVDIAIFPLAIPSIAGPGTILAAVVLTDNQQFTVLEQAVTCLVMLGVLFIQWLLLMGASRIHRLLGDGGTSVLSRVMGLILAALAVETVTAGVREIVASMR